EREDLGAYDFSPGILMETGARIVTLLAAMVAPRNKPVSGIARALRSAWSPRDAGAQEVLSAALILLIDHELAVSSFTARCVASAGSTLYAVVAAGLCALRGVKHGGLTERAEELLREASSARK